MSAHTTATPAGRRLARLAEFHTAANSVLNLATIAVQREIHNAFAAGQITALELHLLQAEWNGVQDHLESFLETISSIRNAAIDEAFTDKIAEEMASWTEPNHPDNHDRDAGRHCLTCQHDLDLDADFRCTRCGSPS